MPPTGVADAALSRGQAGERGADRRGADRSSARASLDADLDACRAGTLALFEGIGEGLFRRSLHPDFSPVGWHLGHIALTEAMWLLGDGDPATTPALRRAFAQDGLAKAERCRIPGRDDTLAYLDRVRAAVLARLDRAPALEARLGRFVLQHEAQHCETVSFLLALAGTDPAVGLDWATVAPDTRPIATLAVPAGEAAIGHDGDDALDNERPAHRRPLAAFRLGRTPVTQAQYAAFMADGGYRRREAWTDAGWAWNLAAAPARPLYWRAGAADHPVCGVSAHEADAFCRWAGARLPTEFEWEHAARGLEPAPGSGNLDGTRGGTSAVGAFPGGAGRDGTLDLIGNVWEWTASPFAAYPGFAPWPYRGYSEAWFDGGHRVLRGGSWATRACAVRASFRNWYVPGTRQILAGFRIARDAP